ncbi:MAG: hypothetical protein ACOCYP_06905 [Planctomycetota bacterium]
MITPRIVLLSCLIGLAALSAADGPTSGKDFRTEDDDLASLPDYAFADRLANTGGMTIPLEVPADCQASIGLYTPSGRLVRILGQALRLQAGTLHLRWDGLDLFGNLVPAGTELELRLVHTPGLRAYYQFTVGHGNPEQPWGGSYTVDGQTRCGGWLGDHSAPNSAVAIGDRVWLGCSLAEHGDNLIAVDGAGHKLWGGNLAGWSGADELDSDGTHLYALHRRGSGVEKFAVANLSRRLESLYEIKRDTDKIYSVGASSDTVYLACRNHQLDIDPFRYPGARIHHAKCTPQVLDGSRPTEFHISKMQGFSLTFQGGGHPQAGIRPVVKGDQAWIVAVFRDPVEFGSIVLAGAKNIGSVEVFALAPGARYNELDHNPLNESGTSSDITDVAAGLGDDGGRDDPLAVDDLDLGTLDLSDDWQPVGSGDLDRPFNLIMAQKRMLDTRALLLRCRRPESVAKGDDWKSGIKLIRLVKERFGILPLHDELHASHVSELTDRWPDNRRRIGWDLRTSEQIGNQEPLILVARWNEPQVADAMALHNCTNPRAFIDAYIGDPGSTPDPHDESQWEYVGRYRAGRDKKLGAFSATKEANTAFALFDRRITSTAFRLRIDKGYQTGKYTQLLGGRGGEGQDNPFRSDCDAIALLRKSGERPVPPETVLKRYAAADGSFRDAHLVPQRLDSITCAPDGTVYALADDRALVRCTVSAGDVQVEELARPGFKQPRGLEVTDDHVIVGDREREAVFICDRKGTVLRTIGGQDDHPRRPGPWRPDRVRNPVGLTVASTGELWVAESFFAPKRVSRFTLDGEFVAEHLGPPMYGGGGKLDPDLKHFYYRSMAFELDYEAGTSRLAGKNTTYLDPASPAPENSSFSFTAIDSPVYHDGRRYIVGNSTGHMVISQLDEPSGQWTPRVIMGRGHESRILEKEVWRRHFAKIDWRDKIFIWCDANDDGDYQIDEVEIVADADWTHGEHAPVGGSFGPGLALWTKTARIKPHRFTAAGTPIYRFADWRPYSYTAPLYHRNYTLGGKTSAKPQFKGFTAVSPSGKRIMEGQPYTVLPDGSILGGSPANGPSDYAPPIDGTVLNQPFGFAGCVATDSQVGEIAMVHSNNGYWYAWGVDYGMIVATIFDGSEGGWGSDLRAERGVETTHRRFGWEAWGADFVKGHDGNYYTSAGKGFHSINRIDGLDAIAVQRQDVRVDQAAMTRNTALRELLKARVAARQIKPPGATVQALEKRVRDFEFDGAVDEWGKTIDWHRIGPEANRSWFDVAQDEQGLVVAITAHGRLGNSADDIREAYRSGFFFDLVIRPDGSNRNPYTVSGDRRIICAKIGDEWQALLYRYAGEATAIDSPYAEVRLAEIRPLDDADLDLAVIENPLGISADSLDMTVSEESDLMSEMIGEPMNEEEAVPSGMEPWSAEIRIPWKLLGRNDAIGVRFDCGIHHAAKEREGVGAAHYWNNPCTATLGDPALAIQIEPLSTGILVAPERR